MNFDMKTENIFVQGLNRVITFYIGKNQDENFDVIDKGLPDDIWFHSKNTSSSHVVASVPENITNKELHYIIKAGAVLCKNNTNKCKSSRNIEFIYTKIKNIQKTNIPGRVTINNEKIIKI